MITCPVRFRMAVVVDQPFFASLPTLPETSAEEADIAWLVYDLQMDAEQNR